MDRWTIGWMDGWVDGWMWRQIYLMSEWVFRWIDDCVGLVLWIYLTDFIFFFWGFILCVSFSVLLLPRLQELEEQYRREREETNNLLEQQRLVRTDELQHWHTSQHIRIICNQGLEGIFSLKKTSKYVNLGNRVFRGSINAKRGALKWMWRYLNLFTVCDMLEAAPRSSSYISRTISTDIISAFIFFNYFF